MIKYLGSKKKILPHILNVLKDIDGVKSVLDVFSGTSRVGHALKGVGYQVFSNDNAKYAHTLAMSYVQADRGELLADAEKLIAEFNSVKPEYGYFTKVFCEESRFFKPENGQKVDAIRNVIVQKNLPPELEAICLTSLMEAADRVDSTTGVQMAYLKQWAARAHNSLHLRVPDILPRAKYGKGLAYCLDAYDFALTVEGDVAYLDPPYNQHKYVANYHIWETLVRNDKPSYYGVACKREDTRDKKSPFNSRPEILQAMRNVLDVLKVKWLIISFSNEGYITSSDMVNLLGCYGAVTRLDIDYKRYVGAQIGVFNPQGERVGKVSHLRNLEHIFIVEKGAVGVRPSKNLTDSLQPQLFPLQPAF